MTPTIIPGPSVELAPSDLLKAFHALSDPIRLNVITLLQTQEFCVCDLCTQLSVSQSKLSFHLKILKDAGLVLARQAGRWHYYRLNLITFAELAQYFTAYRDLPLPPTAPACCP